MAYDFRANQVRLNRIISSGSIPILIYPSSSAADFAGNLVPSFSTSGIGSDVFLYISGSSSAKTVFGGDTLTSGSIRSLSGITGSLQFTDNSSTPFIVSGPDIAVNYNALGQWEISGSEANFFTSPSNQVVKTTGSLEATYLSASTGAQLTGSLQVLGGITGSLSGTSAGNPFIVAGPNVTANYNSLGQWEITGSGGSGFSLSGSITVYGDGINRGSGSISGLFDTTSKRIGKYEIDIIAVNKNNKFGAGWKYSTTTFNETSFSFIGINELAEDLTSSTVGWEVNFNDSGTLDVTGSVETTGTFFYARVTNKMVANFNNILF